MKPIFANTFNVTHDKKGSEVSISFNHVYTEHNFTVTNGTLTDVSGKVADNVASVLLTKEGTVALYKLLSRVVEDWGLDT